MIFYESPYRIYVTIRDMIEIFGDRPAMLAREITKMHEEVMYGTLSTIQKKMENVKPKGEITIVIEGCR
jgi:16S rRNA (cytidine1402-2'-O)-methyltransferase